jgi:hypothetical protein
MDSFVPMNIPYRYRFRDMIEQNRGHWVWEMQGIGCRRISFAFPFGRWGIGGSDARRQCVVFTPSDGGIRSIVVPSFWYDSMDERTIDGLSP